MNKLKEYHLIDENGKLYSSAVPGQFGGHKRLKIYGRLDCSSALRYVSKGQYVQHRVFFANEVTAVKAGYRPCSVCMKNEYLQWKAMKNEGKLKEWRYLKTHVDVCDESIQ